MSAYKGIDLFGSGPHRFAMARQGLLTQVSYFSGGPGSNSTVVGPWELEVVVRGRLVSSTEGGLRAMRDAIAAQVSFPLSPGVLADGRGRTWDEMSLITYQEEDRRDRGRVWSVGYEAVFRRIVV